LIIDYKIGICCFSAKHTALRRKSKVCLARNQNKVSEWSDMSIRGLLFQWASTIKIQLGVLVLNKVDLIIISLKIILFLPWYSWKIAELELNNNHSLLYSLICWGGISSVNDIKFYSMKLIKFSFYFHLKFVITVNYHAFYFNLVKSIWLKSQVSSILK
jgi:hypothetical protein